MSFFIIFQNFLTILKFKMLIKLIIKCENLFAISIYYFNNIDMISKEVFINFSLFRFFSIIIRFLRFHLVILINCLIIREFLSIVICWNWIIIFLQLIHCIIISCRFIWIQSLKFLNSIFNNIIIIIFNSKKNVFSIVVLIENSRFDNNH